jgi:hypothetical protein
MNLTTVTTPQHLKIGEESILSVPHKPSGSGGRTILTGSEKIVARSSSWVGAPG